MVSFLMFYLPPTWRPGGSSFPAWPQPTDCACLPPQNEKGHCPADVVPDPLDMPLEMADAAAVAKELRALLRQAPPTPVSPLPFTLQSRALPALSEKAKVQLASMGLRIGDCVVIAGQKVCYRSPPPLKRLKTGRSFILTVTLVQHGYQPWPQRATADEVCCSKHV